MGIADIVGKLKPGEKVEPENFLAIVVTDELVQAAVWRVVEGKTEIVALGNPVEWDGDTGTTSELISAADATISTATEGLTPEPESAIFGVPNNWTDQKGMVGSKRDLVKKICQELELKALGFVTLTDSVLTYLRMQEGTPATSILIQVARDEIYLLLVRLGRIEGQQTVGRSDDVAADVEEGISRFAGSDNLPSRIIVFNSMHSLEDVVQNLISYDWQSKFNFLHIPKIEGLPKDIAIRSVSVAGGSEVAKSIGFTIEDKDVEAGDVTPPTPAPSPKKVKPREPQPVEANVIPVLSAEEAGFVIGDKQSSPTPVEVNVPTPNLDLEEVGGEEKVAEEHIEKVHERRRVVALPKVQLPSFHFKFPPLPRKPFVAVLIGVAVVALLAFGFVWLLPSATVTVVVATKSMDQSVNLTLSTSASTVDAGSSTVPGNVISQAETGSKTEATTGTKTVGTPAKGEVTIYNRSSLSKTFLKGTILAAGNLKFTLDADATVASSSSDANYTVTPGKATVALTASAIGTAGNLASNTEFTIASYGKDTYVGRNDEALAGGTSQTVQIVSAADKTQVVKDLTSDLVGQAQGALSSQAESNIGVFVLPGSAKVTNDSYSAAVGDQAQNVTGTATITVQAVRYNLTDVGSLVSQAAESGLPEGYILAGTPPSVTLTSDATSADNGQIPVSAKVTFSLVPAVDKTSLAKALTGKQASDVESVLTGIPGFEGGSVKITPLWLPTRFKMMPRNPQKISITISAS